VSGRPGHVLPVLPALSGAEKLHFSCDGCAECCKRFRVALTHHDLARLASELRVPRAELVEWLPPELVDLDAESASLVELGQGARLMVLAHAGGACRLLDDAGRCRAYTARPYDCRLYPFVLERNELGDLSGIAYFEPEGCGESQAEPASATQLAELDARRWAELAEYRALVARWNRLARQRRRMQHPSGGAAEFLAFAARASAGKA
jgi:Fe-S-cluster containining protein